MTTYVDNHLVDIMNNGEPTAQQPTEGWTYATKPTWVHDLLTLWERDKLLVNLLEVATDRTAQDVYNSTMRRRVLHQIAQRFVPVNGSGRVSTTAGPNPWAAYSQLYSANTLAPAYLLNTLTSSGLSVAAITLIHEIYRLGDLVELSEVRTILFDTFGDRASVRTAVSSILRTLVNYRIFTTTTKPGVFRYQRQLTVGAQAMPLLIWAWWRTRRGHIIRIPQLAADPLLTFVDLDSMANYWIVYEGVLWSLESRDGVDCAMLRQTDNANFIRSLFNLLAAHPKWPAVGRQFPMPLEFDEAAVA